MIDVIYNESFRKIENTLRITKDIEIESLNDFLLRYN
jgi:hypothetical protein